jgi:hypothetical protein
MQHKLPLHWHGISVLKYSNGGYYRLICMYVCTMYVCRRIYFIPSITYELDVYIHVGYGYYQLPVTISYRTSY